jgi:urease accessory protein
MRRACDIRTAGSWNAATAIDRVVLDAHERHRRRIALTGERGTAFLLDLPQATALKDGDGQWLSPAYPIGAFSYSSGIEWAVEAGDVTDAATLERWLPAMIGKGSGFCDAVFFVHAHRAAAERNVEALRTVAELTVGLCAVGGAAPGNHGPGPRLPRGAPWPTPARSAAGGLGWSRRAAGCGRRCGRRTRYRARVRLFPRASLVPLGRTDGQRVLAALEPVVAATAGRSLATQHTRLFRS